MSWGLVLANKILFTTLSRLVLGPSQPPILWVVGALATEVKQPGCDANHSPPPRAKRLIIHGGMLYS
jgi:hypothetical protein